MCSYSPFTSCSATSPPHLGTFAITGCFQPCTIARSIKKADDSPDVGFASLSHAQTVTCLFRRTVFFFAPFFVLPPSCRDKIKPAHLHRKGVPKSYRTFRGVRLLIFFFPLCQRNNSIQNSMMLLGTVIISLFFALCTVTCHPMTGPAGRALFGHMRRAGQNYLAIQENGALLKHWRPIIHLHSLLVFLRFLFSPRNTYVSLSPDGPGPFSLSRFLEGCVM